MLRNQTTHRLTVEGNQHLAENSKKIREIYRYWRDKGYSIEEVFYIICSAANMCVHEEALRTRRSDNDRGKDDVECLM